MPHHLPILLKPWKLVMHDSPVRLHIGPLCVKGEEAASHSAGNQQQAPALGDDDPVSTTIITPPMAWRCPDVVIIISRGWFTGQTAGP